MSNENKVEMLNGLKSIFAIVEHYSISAISDTRDEVCKELLDERYKLAQERGDLLPEWQILVGLTGKLIGNDKELAICMLGHKEKIAKEVEIFKGVYGVQPVYVK